MISRGCVRREWWSCTADTGSPCFSASWQKSLQKSWSFHAQRWFLFHHLHLFTQSMKKCAYSVRAHEISSFPVHTIVVTAPRSWMSFLFRVVHKTTSGAAKRFKRGSKNHWIHSRTQGPASGQRSFLLDSRHRQSGLVGISQSRAWRWAAWLVWMILAFIYTSGL